MVSFSTAVRAARVCVIAIGMAFGAQALAADISGAGATFPYPIYAKWAEAYQKVGGVRLNYQSIGSGGGIKQIQASTVTFGASDKPLKSAELDASGLQQFPMIIGGVVPVIHVEGVKPGELVLDGPTLADIYLGKISKWDDARIKALNPGVALPSRAIATVHRSDGSGTNFLFTTYLAAVSPAFDEEVGADASVEWPTGIGGKGNEGVASMTAQTTGAIGYVEYAYAKQNKMTYVRMKNKSGAIVTPEIKTFQAAAGNADWADAPGYYLVLVDQPGKDSWPITGASFILMHKQAKDPAASLTALKFFDWAYRNGADMATELDYVPLPKNVVDMVEKSWANIKAGGKAVWPGQ